MWAYEGPEETSSDKVCTLSCWTPAYLRSTPAEKSSPGSPHSGLAKPENRSAASQRQQIRPTALEFRREKALDCVGCAAGLAEPVPVHVVEASAAHARTPRLRNSTPAVPSRAHQASSANIISQVPPVVAARLLGVALSTAADWHGLIANTRTSMR